MPYRQYLQTAHWRTTRNCALKRAHYRCSKCATKRDLEVHHLSYARLGAELDSDLQVVCRGCHLGLHVHEIEHGLALYMKFVRDAMEAEQFTYVEDLTEEVKARCARARIPYANAKVYAAIDRLRGEVAFDFAASTPVRYRELFDRGVGTQPLTHAEACGIIARLGAQGLIKPMPEVKPLGHNILG